MGKDRRTRNPTDHHHHHPRSACGGEEDGGDEMGEQSRTEAVVEYVFRDMSSGALWLDIVVNREPYVQIGPFDTETERQRAHDDLLKTMRSMGAKDVPLLPQ